MTFSDINNEMAQRPINVPKLVALMNGLMGMAPGGASRAAARAAAAGRVVNTGDLSDDAHRLNAEEACLNRVIRLLKRRRSQAC